MRSVCSISTRVLLTGATLIGCLGQSVSSDSAGSSPVLVATPDFAEYARNGRVEKSLRKRKALELWAITTWEQVIGEEVREPVRYFVRARYLDNQTARTDFFLDGWDGKLFYSRLDKSGEVVEVGYFYPDGAPRYVRYKPADTEIELGLTGFEGESLLRQCSVFTYLKPWVGPNSRMAPFFSRMLGESEPRGGGKALPQGVEQFRGRQCAVFQRETTDRYEVLENGLVHWSREFEGKLQEEETFAATGEEEIMDGDYLVVIHTFLVDDDSFVRKWVTTQVSPLADGGRIPEAPAIQRLTRTHEFVRIGDDVKPEDLRINVPDGAVMVTVPSSEAGKSLPEPSK